VKFVGRFCESLKRAVVLVSDAAPRHIVPLVFTLNLNENRLRNGLHLSGLSLVAATEPRQNTMTLLPECRRICAAEVSILAIADGQVLQPTNRFVFFSSSPRRQILIEEDPIEVHVFSRASLTAQVNEWKKFLERNEVDAFNYQFYANNYAKFPRISF
jgi:hypothetical protein